MVRGLEKIGSSRVLHPVLCNIRTCAFSCAMLLVAAMTLSPISQASAHDNGVSLQLIGAKGGGEPEADSIPSTACRSLHHHIARDDVAFKPGTGVSGSSVTPADLENPSDPLLPDHLEFEILAAPKTLSDHELEAVIGRARTNVVTGTTRVFDRIYPNVSSSSLICD